METSPSYEAISYVWGDLSFKKKILCNGKIIRVAASLYAVLKRLRDSNNSSLLWADAIRTHPDRSGIKYGRNLRSGPLFSEAFDSEHLACRVEMIYSLCY
ncbi:hypothetical protein AOQ84DRAFT_355145 [Glonium stellatum]|uniref:Heterokaryon incompatibility domain-containing protein n=1 Tax=Glonium stellatum TaxID=574774 RepID=A0A8E2JS23_9PEZI|nr:hypothetical protein AOQ84DRAFT_355145 [Glonium stellatum]